MNVMFCIRSHVNYRRCELKARPQILQKCIDYFDSRFTFLLIELVGRRGRDLNYTGEALVLYLGANDDTLSTQGPEAGSRTVAELTEMNDDTWKTLTT